MKWRNEVFFFLLCDQWRIHISPFRTWQMFLKIEMYFFSFCDDISKWWKICGKRQSSRLKFNFLATLPFIFISLFVVCRRYNTYKWDRTLVTLIFTLMLCSSSTLNVSCMSLIFNSTLKFVDWMAWIVPMTTLKSDRTRMLRSRLSRCSYARWI